MSALAGAQAGRLSLGPLGARIQTQNEGLRDFFISKECMNTSVTHTLAMNRCKNGCSVLEAVLHFKVVGRSMPSLQHNLWPLTFQHSGTIHVFVAYARMLS